MDQYQYFKVETRGVNDVFVRTLYKCGVWQTKPSGSIEITEAEYLHYLSLPYPED